MKSINNIFKKVCILAIVTSMAGCDMLDTKPYDFVAPVYTGHWQQNMCMETVILACCPILTI